MNPATQLHGDVCVVTAPSFVDISNHQDFQTRVIEAIRSHTAVLLDLEGMDFIDSAGIADLLKFDREAKANHCRLSICSAQSEVQECLDMVRMGTMIPMHATQDDAIHAMRQ